MTLHIHFICLSSQSRGVNRTHSAKASSDAAVITSLPGPRLVHRTDLRFAWKVGAISSLRILICLELSSRAGEVLRKKTREEVCVRTFG